MSQDITQDILSHAVEEVIAKFGTVNLAALELSLESINLDWLIGSAWQSPCQLYAVRMT